MGKRRKGREVLLQAAYAWLVGGGTLGRHLEDQLERREASPETAEFARELARRLDANLSEIDAWLDGLLQNWAPERVGAVSRTVLRLALTELRYFPEVPWRTVIDEACELARRYADEDAVGFVNGMLDRAAAQQLEAEGGRARGGRDGTAAGAPANEGGRESDA